MCTFEYNIYNQTCKHVKKRVYTDMYTVTHINIYI